MKVGIDHVIGIEDIFVSPGYLISYLHDYGISMLDQGRNICEWSTSGAFWISVEELELREGMEASFILLYFILGSLGLTSH